MDISNTLYGNEIMESMKKSRKVYVKVFVAMGMILRFCASVFTYLFYIEGGQNGELFF